MSFSRDSGTTPAVTASFRAANATGAGISMSRPSFAALTSCAAKNQSDMTKPSKPNSPLRMSVRTVWFSHA